jgi:hypothetical protein
VTGPLDPEEYLRQFRLRTRIRPDLEDLAFGSGWLVVAGRVTRAQVLDGLEKAVQKAAAYCFFSNLPGRTGHIDWTLLSRRSFVFPTPTY